MKTGFCGWGILLKWQGGDINTLAAEVAVVGKI